MLRFVVGPDNRIVPDVGRKLPGRGLWIGADRKAIARAVKKNLFGRAAKAAVTVEADLADQVERLLSRRSLDLLGLARRAGQVVTGFETVREALTAGHVKVLITAADAAAGGMAKLRPLAGAALVVDLFTVGELSLALGRENVVHAAVNRGPLADRFAAEVTRLAGFRTPARQPKVAGRE
jgi:predicted RNA-binding protein YlxR (DUF448 family)